MCGKELYRDSDRHVPLCDTVWVDLSVHYIRQYAGEETGPGACWVKGLLERWNNTENHKQDMH